MFAESGGFVPTSDNPRVELARFRSQGSNWLRYHFARRVLPGPNLMDFGCGCGLGTVSLQSQSVRVLGLDTNAGAIEWAQRCLSPEYPHVAFEVEDAARPLAWTKTYDSIVAFEVIEHVSDPAVLLERLAQSLNPGGLLLVSTPNGAYSRHDPALFRTKFHIDEFSLPEFKQLIPSALEIVNQFGQRRVDGLDSFVLRRKSAVRRRSRSVSETWSRDLDGALQRLSRGIFDLGYRQFNGPAMWRIEPISDRGSGPSGYSTLLLLARMPRPRSGPREPRWHDTDQAQIASPDIADSDAQ